MNDPYERVAKVKIASMIQRDDFKKITEITDLYVDIEMKRLDCRIDNFGRVLWKPKCDEKFVGWNG